MSDVVLNDFRAQWEEVHDAALGAVERVGRSGWWILGAEVRAFEEALAKRWGLSHCVGCASGLDALEIGLRCLGLRPGETVLTTPLSAFATTLAILRAGGVPAFVDVDASGLLDLERVAEVCARDPEVRFLVPVHLYGHALDLERLRALRDAHGLRVVEDCAQAVGATSRGVGVGSVGQMAATSFYPTKNLGAMGDGGAVLTQSPELAERARVLRDYGQSAKYEHVEPGLNSRLDELHAAILRDALLPRLEPFTLRRTEIAVRYRSGIAHAALELPPVPEGCRSVWHLFPVLVKGEREGFREHLRRHGIGSGIHYPKPIPDQEALRDVAGVRVLGPLSQATRFAAREISLPIHPYLSDEDVDRVIEACNAWAG